MKALLSQLGGSASQTTTTQCVVRVSPGDLSEVSIVIPIGPNDTSWQSLIADLVEAGGDAEWLLVATQAKPRNFDSRVAAIGPRPTVQWIVTSPGRAHQMNYGANLSARPFLWFLHADSRIGKDVVAALKRSLHSHPHAIHFFDLEFQDDGPWLARFNALGVRFRSRLLGLPFGDQGLCLSRDAFWRLGGFNENVAYGEDHLLIWAARRGRIQLHRVDASIATSARKYASNGWLATTFVHGWRTWRQAIPEFVKLTWGRWR